VIQVKAPEPAPAQPIAVPRIVVARGAKDKAMTANELEARIEKLVGEAREVGMAMEVMIDVLHDVAEALREALTNPPADTDQ
jgi:hypothetical protein